MDQGKLVEATLALPLAANPSAANDGDVLSRLLLK